MDTLLTEIISFSGTAKGIPARERDRSCVFNFNMPGDSYRGFARKKTNLHHGGTETRRHGERPKLKRALLLRQSAFTLIRVFCLHSRLNSRCAPSTKYLALIA